MSNSAHAHHPDDEPLPPFIRWPLDLPACARWFWHDIVFPYGILFFLLAALIWNFFTPSTATMAE